MQSSIVRRVLVVAPAFVVAFSFVAGLSGCGENADQRKSGTLVVPLDAVEKAGEAAGKTEDAAKGKKK